MKFNKKGLMHPLVVVLIIIVVLVGGVFLYRYFSTAYNTPGNQIKWEDYLTDSKPIGELVGEPSLNFLSYIVGRVPSAITAASSEIGSVIIISLVWLILLLMFGDILSLFGSFSTVSRTTAGGTTVSYSYVAWVIGIALAIIAANLNAVMLIAGVGFMLVSGVGAFAAILGVVTPFVVYIVIHLLFLDNLRQWLSGRKTATQFRAGVTDIEQGIQGAKAFGRAVRS